MQRNKYLNTNKNCKYLNNKIVELNFQCNFIHVELSMLGFGRHDLHLEFKLFVKISFHLFISVPSSTGNL